MRTPTRIASTVFVLFAVVLGAAPYLHDPLLKAERTPGYTVPHAYDFGTEQSPVRDGFQRMTPATVARDDGAGWQSSEPVAAYAIREDFTSTRFPVDVFFNPVQELALTACNEDAAWGREPAEFRVPVEPGDYFVYYLGGVPYRGNFGASPVIAFDLAMNEVSDTVCIPFHTMFENRRYRVSATEAGIRIRFTPRTVWVINALVVVPIAQASEVETRLIGPLEQDIYLIPPRCSDEGQRHLELERPDIGRGIPGLPDASREAGYAVFTGDWLTRVFPDTVPSADSIGASVDLFATPGEWEPACFAVRALDTDVQVTGLRVTAPTRPDGRGIPLSDIRVFRAQYSWLATGTGRGYSNGRTLTGKIAPYLLEPEIACTIRAGTSQPFWLNVRIPQDASPGVYTGQLTVTAAGREATALPFRIRVLPFVLDEPTDMVYGVYWSPIWNWLKRHHRDPAVREEAARREAQEVGDFREHHVDSFTYGYFTGWEVDTEAGTVAPVDPTFPGMAEAVRLWKEAGCSGPIVSTPVKTLYWKLSRELMAEERPENMAYGQQWHRKDTSVPPLVQDLLAKGARIVQDEIARKGYPEFLYYILDESDPKLMQKLYSAVKRVPGVRTYTTSANTVDAVGPWIDVNCSTASFLRTGAWKGEIRERAARGEFEPWIYPNGCVMGFEGSPARSRFIYGFGAWKQDLRGVYPWMYTTNNTKGNPFNDFDRDYPDTGFVMPGPDGLIATIRWDGAREGIDDMRYLRTLANLAQTAMQADSAAARQAGRQALDELERLKQNGVPDDYYMDDTADAWSRHNAQAYRWYIASLIMDLQRTLAAEAAAGDE